MNWMREFTVFILAWWDKPSSATVCTMWLELYLITESKHTVPVLDKTSCDLWAAVGLTSLMIIKRVEKKKQKKKTGGFWTKSSRKSKIKNRCFSGTAHYSFYISDSNSRSGLTGNFYRYESLCVFSDVLGMWYKPMRKTGWLLSYLLHIRFFTCQTLALRFSFVIQILENVQSKVS